MTVVRLETTYDNHDFDEFDLVSQALGVDTDDSGVYDSDLTRDYVLGLD